MKAPFPNHPPTPQEIGELAHLLFEWPMRTSPRLALPFFILIAALIQAGVVFLFSIRYSPSAKSFHTPPAVYFLPSGSPIAKGAEPWLEGHDPSVFSPLRATATAIPEPPPLRYRPSYEDPPPALKGLPEEEPTPLLPPDYPFDGEPLVKPSRFPLTGIGDSSQSSTPPRPSTPSQIRWLDGLEGLARLSATEPRPLPPPSRAVSGPTLYEVSVGSGGFPLTCVVTQSCGDAATDEAGRAWILGNRFEAADLITWGRVQLLWSTPTAVVP